MKKHFTNFLYSNLSRKVAMLVLMVLATCGLSYGQLNGAYTINSGSATSGTNFKSFTDFQTAISAGVSGPVTVDVVAGSGPYTVSVLRFNNISGTSSTNTVTINGNGEKVTSTGSAYPYCVIEINGADWMTFDNLNVENTRSGSYYQKCYWIHNNSDNNTIKNSELTMPKAKSTYNASAYIAIMQSYSSTYSYGDPGENITIENNKMYAQEGAGPYTGIVMVNESRGTTIHHYDIKKNKIMNFYQYGIWGNYVSESNVDNNEITNENGTWARYAYGIYMNNYYKNWGKSTVNGNNVHEIVNSTTSNLYGIYLTCAYGTGTELIVEDNRVHSKTHGTYFYGVYIYGYATNVKKVAVNNNDITGIGQNTSRTQYTQHYGVYAYLYNARNTDEIELAYNRIDVNTNAYAYGIYCYAQYNYGIDKDIDIKNNVVNASSDRYAYGIYVYNNGVPKNSNVQSNTIHIGPWGKGDYAYKYTHYGIYYYGKGKIENNIIDISKKHGGTYYGIYITRTTGTTTFKHNNLWLDPAMSGTKRYGYYNGTRSAFSTWTSYVGTTTSSTNHATNFIDVDNFVLVPNNPNLRDAGMYISNILDDTWMETRDVTTPDIGAIEFYYDLAIDTILIAGKDECSGYEEDIKIVLVNKGDVRLPNVEIDLYENGVFLTTVNSGPLGKLETINVPYSAKWIGEGNFTYRAVITPNDEVSTNDEASSSIDIYAAPSGGSLIAGSGSAGMHLPSAFDVTIVPDGIEFELTPPTAFDNTEYNTGSGWEVEVSTTLLDGTPVATADEATFTAPSGIGTDGIVKLYPTSTVIDETLRISVRVYDEISNCDTFIVRDVLIAPEGAVDFIFPQVNCADQSVAFDNASTVSTGRLTYEWDFGDGTTSTDVHPIHDYAAAGTYTVKLTSTTVPYGYKNSISKTIDLKSVPTADFTKVNACEGSDIVLTNTSVGADDYEWDLGDPSKPIVTLTNVTTQYAPGGYDVTLTANKGGCKASVTKPVYQYAMPVSGFSVLSGDCSTDEYVFDNNSFISNGSVGYTWDFQDGSISTDANPRHMFARSGSFNVELSAISEFGCVNKSIQNVSVKEGPNVDFTYGAVCSESATPFTNTSTYPSGLTPTYKWNFGDGSATSTDENPNHVWAISGELTVSLEVSVNNCVGMKEEVVKVQPEPVADFTLENACTGDDVVFANKSTWKEGEINYTWDFDGAIVSPTDVTSPRAKATTAGTFDISLTAEVTDGCSHTVNKTFVVSDAPVSCNIVKTADHGNGLNAYKFDASIDGVDPGTESNVEYYWSVQDHGNYTGSTIGVDFRYDGDFLVSLTAKNTLTGCECSNSINYNNVGLEDDIAFGNSIDLYPNPAKENVTISLAGVTNENISLEVLTITGAVIISAKDYNVTNGKVQLVLGDLTDGLYIVRIKKGNTVSNKKLRISK